MLLRRKSSRRTAATLVEMAFVSLICLTLMMAIFEYGRYVFVRQVMENAARAGARQAVITPTSYLSTTVANSDVNTAITNVLVDGQIQNMSWTAYQANSSGSNIGPWTATPFGNNLVVQIDADLPLLFPSFSFLNPGASPNSIHLTVKCMMRSEAN